MSGIDAEIFTQPLRTMTVELTEEEAQAILTAISVAQDEMPWSEYEEAWRTVSEMIAERFGA